MRSLLLLPLCLFAGCGQREEAPVSANEATRITDQIDRQAKQIADQAENGAAVIEQALENEGAAIFDNREALLNEPGNAAAVSGNSAR